MNHCIVNVAVGLASHYYQWQDRLRSSLDEQGYDGGRMFWRGDLPMGCPPHKDVPYAMKPYAFAAAAQAGYRQVLWCDSAVWARRPLGPAFDAIGRDGYLLFLNGYVCGEWCTDAALAKQGFTRDEAMAVPDFTGCCMGLDLSHPAGREFYQCWRAAADDGISFIGDWNNDRGQCSPDKRCKGHRHDQVVGSLIARRMGLTLRHGADHERVRPGGLFSYWIAAMADNPPDLESVCLVNNRP